MVMTPNSSPKWAISSEADSALFSKVNPARHAAVRPEGKKAFIFLRLQGEVSVTMVILKIGFRRTNLSGERGGHERRKQNLEICRKGEAPGGSAEYLVDPKA